MRLAKGINHLAIATDDMRTTLDYYCNVVGLPLGGLFWMHGVEGAVHAFLPFPDGRMLSFIQFAESTPQQKGVSYPGWAGGAMPAGTMQHVALHLEDRAELDAMRDRLVAKGRTVSEPMDHGFCVSIYTKAPDRVELEFTILTRPLGPEELDPEVVAHCGISPEELASFLNPA